MKTFLVTVAAAAAMLTSPAQASDVLRTTEFYADQAVPVENVRLVCDEFGRCRREARRRAVIIDDSYNYAPRERYIERRYYDDRPRAGFGVHAPGVSIGVGVGGHHW